MTFYASHGGYPGEIVAHDEYLACEDCGWSYPLDQNDYCCEECSGVLVVRDRSRVRRAPRCPRVRGPGAPDPRPARIPVEVSHPSRGLIPAADPLSPLLPG
jgi:hypothetical protein